MFTGIVEELGRLEGISSIARGSQLRIGADLVLDGLEEGESLAVDGVCLTVTEVGRSSFSVQVVKNTLEETTLGRVKVGEKLNLERSLSLASRLGGWIFSGHIDTVGRIRGKIDTSLTIEVDRKFIPFLVEKGSVAINGVNLTVGKIAGDRFSIFLIPYTLMATNLGEKKVGDRVNVEFDLFVKYLQAIQRNYGKDI